MRGVCSTLKMVLYLNVVGSVSPTESTTEGSVLHCEGLNNQTYICESGHCCGESKCCSYYYELWWFWLVWAIIFILSCCCICHHRRTKHRLQQQQRQHEINLIAYREAHNYTSVPFYFRFLPNYLLPDYEEVVNRPPTPPPPYSALHTVSSAVASSPLSNEQPEGHCPAIQSTPVVPASDVLCSRLSLESNPSSMSFGPKLDNKPPRATQDSGTILRSDRAEDGLAGEGGEGMGKRDRVGGDSCKEPLLKDLGGSEGCMEDKQRLPTGGRRRRFTGDSGIEVCVCGTRGSGGFSGAGVQEGKELKELESLLGCAGDEEEEEEEAGGEFCESCGHRAHLSGDEEQAPGGPERGVAREPLAAPPMAHQPIVSSCTSGPPLPLGLLLHTINEQEGPHHGSSTEPQG